MKVEEWQQLAHLCTKALQENTNLTEPKDFLRKVADVRTGAQFIVKMRKRTNYACLRYGEGYRKGGKTNANK